jgi:two-component system sensor histidine kinase KdpD
MEILSRTRRLLVCTLLVAGETWVGYAALHVNALVVGLVYVLTVLIVATRWGLFESMATSVVATVCLNYFFFPPVLSLTIADPQNWVALLVFLITASTTSQLSASVRQEASNAREKRTELERLYQLCVSLMLIDANTAMGPQITSHIRQQYGFRAVAFHDSASGELCLAGTDGGAFQRAAMVAFADDALKEENAVGRQKFDEEELQIVRVHFGGRRIGSLGVLGSGISDSALQAMASLVAILFEHARQQAEFGRLEVARQNERLRNVLLDALAHDFLTPLTTIKSAITTVRTEYEHSGEEEDFLSAVEEETDRLGAMIDETTDMARIGPGKPRVRMRAVQIEELIQTALRRMKNLLEGRRVTVDIQGNLPNATGDAKMLGLVLRQLIGNAAKYSPQETDIDITAFAGEQSITVQILDHGPGIAPEESSLIFERFYRGKKDIESVTGTGMGLPIARDILAAHQGELWVENVAGAGARFTFTLPVDHEVEGHAGREDSDRG